MAARPHSGHGLGFQRPEGSRRAFGEALVSISGLSPNAVTLSALINACGRAGQLTGARGAFRVLADMQRQGLRPNVITYTTLIDACAKARELRWALALFREMLEQGVATAGGN